MYEDDSTGDLRVGGWLPERRVETPASISGPTVPAPLVSVPSGPGFPGSGLPASEAPRSAPDAVVAGWPGTDETMVLPAFVTGGHQRPPWSAGPPPSRAAHAAPSEAPVRMPISSPEPPMSESAMSADPISEHPMSEHPMRAADSDRLPRSERNMLIFVASLLAAGTLAVVTTLGFSRLTSHPATPAVTRTVSPSATATPSR